MSELVSLLWTDDDCTGVIRAFEYFFSTSAGFALERATSYAGALRMLAEASTEGNAIEALLVDVVLPEAEESAALSPDLGLRLAGDAPQFGVKRVAILSVVELNDLQPAFDALKTANGAACHYRYHNKAEILEGSKLEQLLQFLRGHS